MLLGPTATRFSPRDARRARRRQGSGGLGIGLWMVVAARTRRTRRRIVERVFGSFVILSI